MNTAHFCLGLVFAFHCLLSLVEASEDDIGTVSWGCSGFIVIQEDTGSAGEMELALEIAQSEPNNIEEMLSILGRSFVTVEQGRNKYYHQDGWKISNGMVTNSVSNKLVPNEEVVITVKFSGRKNDYKVFGKCSFRPLHSDGENEEMLISFEAETKMDFRARKDATPSMFDFEGSDTESPKQGASHSNMYYYAYVFGGAVVGVAVVVRFLF